MQCSTAYTMNSVQEGYRKHANYPVGLRRVYSKICTKKFQFHVTVITLDEY